MDTTPKTFYAYDIYGTTDMPLTTAPVDRAWMDATDQHFAYRCLPLAIANQAGWLIHNPASFNVWWDGGPHIDNLQLQFGGASRPAISTVPAARRPWSVQFTTILASDAIMDVRGPTGGSSIIT